MDCYSGLSFSFSFNLLHYFLRRVNIGRKNMD
nr:MAG TPA: hypothetical protein [Caudoviricetes sp.]